MTAVRPLRDRMTLASMNRTLPLPDGRQLASSGTPLPSFKRLAWIESAGMKLTARQHGSRNSPAETAESRPVAPFDVITL